MATTPFPVTITLTYMGGSIGTATVDVPLTINAGPMKDGRVPLTVDQGALQARLTAAMEAFRKVAEA